MPFLVLICSFFNMKKMSNFIVLLLLVQNFGCVENLKTVNFASALCLCCHLFFIYDQLVSYHWTYRDVVSVHFLYSTILLLFISGETCESTGK